jgi:hypothetical protein
MLVTSIATVRIFDFKCDMFKIMGIYTRGNYGHEGISELFND